MAFPTSSLTNNLVHKEGNRAFVYDSALGVWDQVRETDRTENKFIQGEIGAGVTLTNATFPAGHVIKTTTFMQNFTSHYYYTLTTSATVITFNSIAMQITGLSATEGNKLLIWASAGDLRHVNDGTYQSSLGFIIDGTFYSSHGNWYNASLVTWPTTSLMVFTVPASFTSKTISYAGSKETGSSGTHSMMARGGLTGGYTTSIIIQEIAV